MDLLYKYTYEYYNAIYCNATLVKNKADQVNYFK